MNKINLHPIDREFAWDRLRRSETRYTDLLNVVRNDYVQLNALQAAAYQYAASLCILEPDSPQIPKALKVASQACTAIFAQITARDGNTVTLPLGEGAKATFPGLAPNPSTDSRRWVEGFYLAAITRDVNSLQTLCDISMYLLTQSPTRVPECTHLQVRTLQAYWKQEDNFVDCLVAAINATDAERVSQEVGDWGLSTTDVDKLVEFTLMITVPELKLLVRVVEQDVALFNKALYEALDLHQQYWQADNEAKDIQDSSTFLSLGSLAMSSFAYAQGMEVQVESDYLPPRLYMNYG
jgi:Immunity protein 49